MTQNAILLSKEEIERLRKFEPHHNNIGNNEDEEMDEALGEAASIDLPKVEPRGKKTEAVKRNRQSLMNIAVENAIINNSTNEGSSRVPHNEEWKNARNSISKAVDNFIVVKGKKRRLSQQQDQARNQSVISVPVAKGVTNNRFAALDTSLAVSEEHSYAKINEVNNNFRIRNNRNNINCENNSEINLPVKIRYCPPIFVAGLDNKVLHTAIHAAEIECGCSDNKYYFVNIGEFKKKVFVSNLEVHASLLREFRYGKAEAFSFAPKERKKHSILLRGVEGGTDVVEIEEAIKEQIPHIKIEKIVPFTTTRSRREGYPTNLFVVQLQCGQEIKEIVSINYLLYQRVSWEKKRINGYLRCFRCQRFGHAGEYCTYTSRCVVCGESHDSEVCIINNKEAALNSSIKKSSLKCANCGEVGHPASYQGCPMYQKYKQRRELLKQKSKVSVANRREWVHDSVNRLVNPGMTYANTLRNSITSNASPVFQGKGLGLESIPEIERIFSETQKIFNKPLFEVLQRLKNFWPNYDKLQNNESKAIELLKLFGTLLAP